MAFRSSYWITQWRAEGWDPPNVIVNLGANDSGFCNVNLACAREAILHLVDTIGPGHKIWWPQITRLYTHQGQQDTWNLALQQIADERDDFYTWDWPTVMASGPFPSSDGTHLAPDGYRRRSQLMAETFTADIAVATHVGGDAPLAQPLGAPSEYVPLAPERIVDTRTDPPGRIEAGGTLTVDLADDVPAGTTAVAVNLTATQPAAAGFLTAHPCDRARRDVSSVNYPAGGDRGAMAVIPLSAAKTLCVYSDAASHVIVDLQGAFVAAPASGAGLQPLSTPSRIADTRNTGRTSILTIPVPAGSDAVAVNLTATAADAPGFLTAYPCGGAVPNVSNVNFGPTEPVAGSAFVPTSDADTICVVVLDLGRRHRRHHRFVHRRRRAAIRSGRTVADDRHPQRSRRLGADPRPQPDDRQPRRAGGCRGGHGHADDRLARHRRVPHRLRLRYAAGDVERQRRRAAGARQRPDGRRQRRGPSVSHRVGRDPFIVRHHRLVGDVTPETARGG